MAIDKASTLVLYTITTRYEAEFSSHDETTFNISVGSPHDKRAEAWRTLTKEDAKRLAPMPNDKIRIKLIGGEPFPKMYYEIPGDVYDTIRRFAEE